MKITRRNFLKGVGVAGVAATLPAMTGCGDDGEEPDTLPQYEYDGPPGSETIFSHGVASGDPLADAVVLWTRVTEPGDTQVEVFYEIAESPTFRRRAAVGYVTTDADSDFTVKVDVDGLSAGTTYYYRFFAKDRMSPVGRTRTAPEGSIDQLRFAVMSCSSLAHGYFQAYRHVAQVPDLDAVLHLGDYIYEYASRGYGSVRTYEPAHEIITLADYRERHNQYKRDPDLQLAHQQHPFICVWDDHESANDSWVDGAQNHTEGAEGLWAERKLFAAQAYSEWMPIRDQEDILKIWRKLPYGDLVDLLMLDTRLWGRDEQSGTDSEERTLLGLDQEEWLGEQLQGSTARWKLLGQQVMCGQLTVGGQPLNNDQWDGYAAARERLFDQIEETPGGNVVVLTGDIHTSWAIELSRDPDASTYVPGTGQGTLAVEFVTPGVTSPGLANALRNPVLVSNPQVRYLDLEFRGYMVLDVTRASVQCDWYHVKDVTVVQSDVTWDAGWTVRAGETFLTEAEAPSPGKSRAPALAPYEVRLTGFPGSDI